MDVKAKQKLLLKQLKQKIKKLQAREEESRARVQAALKQVNKIGHTYKIRLARKMREMERKIAHTEAACYLKIAKDLEEKLVKGIKHKVRALTAAAKRANAVKPNRARKAKRAKR